MLVLRSSHVSQETRDCHRQLCAVHELTKACLLQLRGFGIRGWGEGCRAVLEPDVCRVGLRVMISGFGFRVCAARCVGGCPVLSQPKPVPEKVVSGIPDVNAGQWRFRSSSRFFPMPVHMPVVAVLTLLSLSLSLSLPCHPEGPASWGSAACCMIISILLYSVSARTMRGPSADCITAGGRQRLASADDRVRHHPRLYASHGSFFKTGPLSRHASERGPCDANSATDANLMPA